MSGLASPGTRPVSHLEATRLTAAAGSTPCARYSSSRGRRAVPAVARHPGRAAPDGRPRARRVGPDAARGASRDRPSRGPRRGPRPSASPAVARLMSAGSDGRVCVGSGWRSPDDRSGRSAARSSSASRRRQRGARSLDRRRRENEPYTAHLTSNSGARWWRQERSARSQAVARATGSFRSRRARRSSSTTSG